MDVNEALKQGGARSGAGHRRLQNVLVVAEVALALVLLVGAGLLIQTFYRLRQIDVGFRAENLLTLQTRLPRARYLDHAKRTAFFQQTLERMRALSGVVSAAYTSGLPMAGQGGLYTVAIEGRPAQAGVAMEAGHRQISPEYFTTLGIPIKQGHAFDERDTLQTQPVAIINETMARRFFPGESAIGKRFSFDDDVQGRPATDQLTIIGIAGDVKHRGLENDIRPELYLPRTQAFYNAASIPSYLVIHTTTTLGDPLRLAMAVIRVTLLTAYAALALLLAAVGIYGVLAYFVVRHAAEIGIRVALGAQAGDVLRFVLRRGMGEVAVTFDDLPAQPGNAQVADINKKLVESIIRHKIPAVGFVNERRLYVRGETDARIALLRMWLDAGLELGNHTFSHLQIDHSSLADYKEDVIRGETVTRMLLGEKGMKLRYFRHPQLRTGPTLEYQI